MFNDIMCAQNSPRRRPTLKDVANQAGVSIMSVSLAIRSSDDSRRVSLETRRRVLDAVQELGYRPDARARALRLRQTNVIGFYAGYGWINVRIPFYAESISGLQIGCELVEKNLLLHSLSRNAASEEVYFELIGGSVDGLVVAMPPTDTLAARLASDHLPVVAIADPLPGIPSVVVDDAAGARMIAEHISELGHRSVVFAAGPALPISGKIRQQAFIEAAMSQGMEVVVRSLGDDSKIPEFVACAHRDRTTAIVAWNDIDARRILAGCRIAGLDVPGELAIVGFDGCTVPFVDPFPLTTIRAPWSEVAQESVMVLDRLIRNEPYDMHTVLPVQFVRGATT